ncbi:MAG: Hsp20/alpha crystallin family protein [Candidatus Limnocylindrales bacterium]
MTTVRRTGPFSDLVSLRQAMDRLFEDSYVRPRWAGDADSAFLPLDIYRSSDALVVKAALPGVKPEDVDITVEGDALTVSGEFREERSEDERGYLFRELRRGRFSRTIQLPGDVSADQAQAHYEHGMLTLTLPKRDEARPRQIRITPVTDDATNAAGSDRRPSDGR